LLGIPARDIGLILTDIDRWVSHSGVEWTINRLKGLRQSYLRFLAGDSYELPNFANKVHHGFRTPKGVWGKFWTKDSNRVAVSLKVYHCYTVFTLEQITPSQRSKFLDSCCAPLVPLKDITLIRNVMAYATRLSFNAKPYRRSLTQNVNALSPRHRKKFPRDFSRCVDLIYQDELDLSGLVDQWGGFELWFSKRNPSPSNGLVGNLGVTQERGGKLRVFAFPNLLFQVMLNPMKASLLRILKRIREDCTYDQAKGVEWVERAQRDGRKVFSVDLSDATNHFSFDLQRIAMESIFRHPEWVNHLGLWEYVSKGRFGAHAIGVPSVSWTKGQPLGTGPSFPAFAITHHAVLHHCKVVRGKTDLDCYRILGDDIVITDEDVYNEYRRVILQLGCPVSEPKTFESHDLAEFGGMVMYKGMTIPSTKWKDIHLGNITNDAWIFKDRGVRSLPETWRQVYKEWYSTYHSNSLGLTRDQRAGREANFLLFREEQRKNRCRMIERVTFQSLYYAILEEDDETFDTSESTTPDQDVRIAVEPFGFSTVKIPVAAFAAKFGTKQYASITDLRINVRPFALGELRAFRDANNV
jgi:hypothetical protein